VDCGSINLRGKGLISRSIVASDLTEDQLDRRNQGFFDIPIKLAFSQLRIFKRTPFLSAPMFELWFLGLSHGWSKAHILDAYKGEKGFQPRCGVVAFATDFGEI
jgi:hypothetical protein